MKKYKLVQNGHPFGHEKWFSGIDAIEFEDMFFENKEEAILQVFKMCENSGTSDDKLFNENSPTVMNVSDYNAEFGDDAEDVFYW